MSKNLFKDSVLYGVMNAVQKLAPFVIIPLVIHHLGKEALKIYDVAFSYAFLFSWLIVLGQEAAAGLLYFDERKTNFDKRQVTTYAFVLQMGSLLFFGCLLFSFFGTWGRLLFSVETEIGGWWRTALFVLPGQVALNYALNLLLWRRRKTAYAVLCAVQTTVSIGGVYVSFIFFTPGLAALFYTVIGSITITALLGLLMVREQLTSSLFPVNTLLLKTLLRLGIPFALTAFFQQALPAVDRFFLLYYKHGNELAPYVLASKLGSLVNFGSGAFVLAFTPYSLTKLNDADADEDLSILFRLVSTVAFLAVPFALLFKDVLIAFFADASYREATGLLPFFFFGWVFDLFGYFTVLGIYRSHKTHLSLWLFGLGFALISLLNILLVPHLGLYGAALAFCVCKAALFFLSRLWLKKYFHLRIAAGFWLVLAVAAACSYLVYVLPLFAGACIITSLITAVALYWRKNYSHLFTK